jgi:rhodanese-related sulfurtransferase
VRFGGVPEVEAGQVGDDAVLLDVREDDEWAAGHVAGSTHLPMSELLARADEVPATDPLVVVCRVGGRSAQVAAWLRGQGREAYNLAGGLESWAAAGRPLVTDSGAPGTVL